MALKSYYTRSYLIVRGARPKSVRIPMLHRELSASRTSMNVKRPALSCIFLLTLLHTVLREIDKCVMLDVA